MGGDFGLVVGAVGGDCDFGVVVDDDYDVVAAVVGDVVAAVDSTFVVVAVDIDTVVVVAAITFVVDAVDAVVAVAVVGWLKDRASYYLTSCLKSTVRCSMTLVKRTKIAMSW